MRHRLNSLEATKVWFTLKWNPCYPVEICAPELLFNFQANDATKLQKCGFFADSQQNIELNQVYSLVK